MANPFARSTDPAKRRSPWRWLRRIGASLLVLLVVIGIRQFFWHREVVAKLQEALAELDRTDPGWRLQDIEAARVVIPDEENGALVSMEVARLLPSDWPPDKELEESLGSLESPFMLDDKLSARLDAELEQLQEAVRVARRLRRIPSGRYPLHYEQNILVTRFETQQKARATCALLRNDGFACAQKSDLKGATTACIAAFNTGRSIGDEPTVISQLIRMACISIGCVTTERVLAQGEPYPQDLKELQDLLMNEDLFPTSRIVLSGERANFHRLFESLESGEVRLSELGGKQNHSSNWEDSLLGWYVRDKVRAEHPLMLDLFSRFIAADSLPEHDQAIAERELHDELKKLVKSGAITGLIFPAFDKVMEACRRQHVYIRCMFVVLALERYRQKYSKWPDSLEQLVPEFLGTIPLDSFDGKPLRYKRLEDGVIVYSVGKDGVDNDGTFDRKNWTRPGTDIGWRLWDVKKRRQPAPPPPPKEKPVEPFEKD